MSPIFSSFVCSIIPFSLLSSLTHSLPRSHFLSSSRPDFEVRPRLSSLGTATVNFILSQEWHIWLLESSITISHALNEPEL